MGFVILGLKISFPVSTWVSLSSSPVIFRSRSLFSLILSARDCCSSLRLPTRWSSKSFRLIMMAEIGVFNSCEIVDINVVLAESNSLNSVIFFNRITLPTCFSPSVSVSVSLIGTYIALKKLSLLSAYIFKGSCFSLGCTSSRIRRRNKSFFNDSSSADWWIMFSRLRFSTARASLLTKRISRFGFRPMIGSWMLLTIASMYFLLDNRLANELCWYSSSRSAMSLKEVATSLNSCVEWKCNRFP